MGDQEKDRWTSAPNGTAKTAVDRQVSVLTALQDALERLSYGAIQLTVHDGKVVQLDVTEKRRFPS